MTSPPQQPRRNDAREAGQIQQVRQVIVLPDVDRDATLAQEFGEYLPLEAIERAVAAARHALERSHQPATAEAVKRLAREHLLARVATLSGRRR